MPLDPLSDGHRQVPAGQGPGQLRDRTTPRSALHLSALDRDDFLEQKRNLLLIGELGRVKPIWPSPWAQCRAPGKRVRFYGVVDLVNQLEQEKAAGKAGSLPTGWSMSMRLSWTNWATLPFAESGGALLFHLISKLYERTSLILTTNLAFQRMEQGIYG